MHSPNWDNLRYILAVIDAGSLSGAARDLKVNHATILRRIATFEAEYGGAIFEKRASGYRLLPGKVALVEALREVENSVLTVERQMMGANPELSGTVRISSTDTICQFLLPDLLPSLKSSAPQLEIDLLSNNTHVDFARMEADLFVRPAMTKPDGMNAQTPTQLVMRAFGTPNHVDKWFGLQGPLAKSAAGGWMSENLPQDSVTSGSDSFVVLSRMAQTGAGIAILPSFVGDTVPGLVHLADRMPDIKVPIWVGTHQDLRDIPRIRAVRKAVISFLSDHQT